MPSCHLLKEGKEGKREKKTTSFISIHLRRDKPLLQTKVCLFTDSLFYQKRVDKRRKNAQ